jgi:hypothetical protein
MDFEHIHKTFSTIKASHGDSDKRSTPFGKNDHIILFTSDLKLEEMSHCLETNHHVKLLKLATGCTRVDSGKWKDRLNDFLDLLTHHNCGLIVMQRTIPYPLQKDVLKKVKTVYVEWLRTIPKTSTELEELSVDSNDIELNAILAAFPNLRSFSSNSTENFTFFTHSLSFLSVEYMNVESVHHVCDALKLDTFEFHLQTGPIRSEEELKEVSNKLVLIPTISMVCNRLKEGIHFASTLIYGCKNVTVDGCHYETVNELERTGNVTAEYVDGHFMKHCHPDLYKANKRSLLLKDLSVKQTKGSSKKKPVRMHGELY